LFGVVACSGAVTTAHGARVQTLVAPAPTDESASATSAMSPTTNARLDYQEMSESDRLFIENAERAIGEYSEFLARAGESAEYAHAVKRSREQIEDLREAIVFVRAGAAQRAAH
jgi:hypothetical protein